MSAQLSVLEPATEMVLATVPRAGVEDVDAAVAAAVRALPAWRALAPGERARILYALADTLAAHLEELAVLEARNAGKAIGDARGEMGMVVDTFRYYAGAPERLLGDTIPVAASGGWLNEDTVRAEVIFLETPHRMDIECSLPDRTSMASWRHPSFDDMTLRELHCPG